MRRAFAGLRAARIRPYDAVRISAAGAAIAVLAACGPADRGGTGSAQIAVSSIAATTAPATTVAPVPTATAAPATTTAAPTTEPAPTTVAPRTRTIPTPVAPPSPTPKPAPRPRPAPKPAPEPTAAPAPSGCDPGYLGQCLKDGIGDYDCSSGTGNGPNYVYGTVRVVGDDPFGLDRDHDGLGCEKG